MDKFKETDTIYKILEYDSFDIDANVSCELEFVNIPKWKADKIKKLYEDWWLQIKNVIYE